MGSLAGRGQCGLSVTGREYELRGSVVIDKSFVFMALACAAAPLLGAGIYVVVHLF